MNGAVDLSSHAPKLTALAAQVAATPTGSTALRALAAEILMLAPALASAPGAAAPTDWAGLAADDVLFGSGPGVELMVDGPCLAPRAVHLMVGDRALMIQPVGGGQRVRLIDGTQVLADRTFPLVGESVDHLDAEAAVQRSFDRLDRALDRRPAEPETTAELPPPLDGTAGGPMRGALGKAAAGAGLAAAAGAGLAAARTRRQRRAPLTASGNDASEQTSAAPVEQTGADRAGAPWAATHVVPEGGLGARTEANADVPLSARLDAGVQLRVVRTWGAWAQVDAANGWTGWVDGRRLTPLP